MSDAVLDEYITIPIARSATLSSKTEQFIDSLNFTMLYSGYTFLLASADPNDPDNRVLIIGKYRGESIPHNIRGAGRKPKFCDSMTCGTVRSMMATHPANEVAKILGVSRSTLFRRLRGKPDQDDF